MNDEDLIRHSQALRAEARRLLEHARTVNEALRKRKEQSNPNTIPSAAELPSADGCDDGPDGQG
jgi:hypothetical protein